MASKSLDVALWATVIWFARIECIERMLAARIGFCASPGLCGNRIAIAAVPGKRVLQSDVRRIRDAQETKIWFICLIRVGQAG